MSKIIFDAGEFYAWIDNINDKLEPTDGVFILYDPGYDEKEEMEFLWKNENLSIKLKYEESADE